MDNSDGFSVARDFILSTAGSEDFMDPSLLEAISSLYNDFVSEGSVTHINFMYNL